MKLAVHCPPSVNVMTPGCTVALDAGAQVGAPSATLGSNATAKTAARAAVINCLFIPPAFLVRTAALGSHPPAACITGRVAVAVCTDTTNYLPRDFVVRNGIHEVSLYVSLDGNQQREADILEDMGRFYDALRATEAAATTSQPAVGDFLEVWRPLLDDGDDIVSVHISSDISGTY